MAKSKWTLTAQEIAALELERPALEALIRKQLFETFQLAVRLQKEMAEKALIFGPKWYLI